MALRKKRTMKYQRLKVPIEHTGFFAYLQEYNEAMLLRNFSASTLNRRESDIRRFVGWCDERSIRRPQDVTKPIVERYQKYLFYYRQDNGEPLSNASRIHYLGSVKQFFKWMARQNYLLYNPASEVELPKYRPGLPVVLSVEDVEQTLQQPDINTPYGLRDRAILELLYSTGIRRTELINLQLHDLSLSRKSVYIRMGKGGKDRLLPVGDRALSWVKRYLAEVRPKLLLDVTEETLFLNDYGACFRDNKLGDRVKRFMKNAGINVPGSCHLLRHAMATHMLENGAELRYIQVMLGHADLKATQVYTHVSIEKLRDIHNATHPAKTEDKAALLIALAAETAEDERD